LDLCEARPYFLADFRCVSVFSNVSYSLVSSLGRLQAPSHTLEAGRVIFLPCADTGVVLLRADARPHTFSAPGDAPSLTRYRIQPLPSDRTWTDPSKLFSVYYFRLLNLLVSAPSGLYMSSSHSLGSPRGPAERQLGILIPIGARSFEVDHHRLGRLLYRYIGSLAPVRILSPAPRANIHLSNVSTIIHQKTRCALPSSHLNSADAAQVRMRQCPRRRGSVFGKRCTMHDQGIRPDPERCRHAESNFASALIRDRPNSSRGAALRLPVSPTEPRRWVGVCIVGITRGDPGSVSISSSLLSRIRQRPDWRSGEVAAGTCDLAIKTQSDRVISPNLTIGMYRSFRASPRPSPSHGEDPSGLAMSTALPQLSLTFGPSLDGACELQIATLIHPYLAAPRRSLTKPLTPSHLKRQNSTHGRPAIAQPRQRDSEKKQAEERNEPIRHRSTPIEPKYLIRRHWPNPFMTANLNPSLDRLIPPNHRRRSRSWNQVLDSIHSVEVGSNYRQSPSEPATRDPGVMDGVRRIAVSQVILASRSP